MSDKKEPKAAAGDKPAAQKLTRIEIERNADGTLTKKRVEVAAAKKKSSKKKAKPAAKKKVTAVAKSKPKTGKKKAKPAAKKPAQAKRKTPAKKAKKGKNGKRYKAPSKPFKLPPAAKRTAFQKYVTTTMTKQKKTLTNVIEHFAKKGVSTSTFYQLWRGGKLKRMHFAERIAKICKIKPAAICTAAE